MKKILSLIILILLADYAYPQPAKDPYAIDSTTYFFEADTVQVTPVKPYDHIIDSTFKLSSDFELELRFTELYLSSNFDNVFILTRKNSRWTGRYFEQDPSFLPKTVFKEKHLTATDGGRLWHFLLEHDLLQLPYKTPFRNQMVEYVIDTNNLEYGGSTRHADFIDGVAYQFKLSAPGRTKSFCYANPQASLKLFPNIRELYEATMVVMLIKKFLGKPVSR